MPLRVAADAPELKHDVHCRSSCIGMSFDVDQLAVFAAVARERSFTRAGAALDLTQPAVSQIVARLERRAGQRLVRRRPFGLTEAGELLLVRADIVLRELVRARQDLDDLVGLRIGTVHLGCMQWAGPLDVPALLGRFRRSHPHVHLRLHEDASATMLELVVQGALNLAIVSSNEGLSTPGVVLHEMGREALVIVGTADRLGQRPDPIELQVLHGQPFIAFGARMHLRSAIDTACARAGVVSDVVCESNDLHTVRQLAAHGVGLAIVPTVSQPRPAQT